MKRDTEWNVCILGVSENENEEKRKRTNREELLFCTVFALPNASRTGFDSKICSLTFCTFVAFPVTAAMYCYKSISQFLSEKEPNELSSFVVKFFSYHN
jgi:hypothetical protein